MTGCGKTEFVLDLMEVPYSGGFQHIVFLWPTVCHNKAYQRRRWIWNQSDVYVVDPGDRLHDYLRV